MFDDYELYQGVVLRQLVVAASMPLSIEPFDYEGRINCFVLNGRVGIFLKHSSKRMTPWQFTFQQPHVKELRQLMKARNTSFAVFVCGLDGAVCLEASALFGIIDVRKSESAWIRIERRPRKMYGISGNAGDLSGKVARGLDVIIDALQLRAKS